MSELLILYNAAGSWLGHLKYAVGHFRQDEKSACAACTLTHGKALSLSESPEWKELKKRLEDGELCGTAYRVRQLHTDETDAQVNEYLKANNFDRACILMKSNDQLSPVLLKSELQKIDGDITSLSSALEEKLGKRSKSEHL